MQIVIDETDVDRERVEALVDAVLLCLAVVEFEYAEQEAAVALCNVLSLIVGDEGETIH